jgi:hypothetical protein
LIPRRKNIRRCQPQTSASVTASAVHEERLSAVTAADRACTRTDCCTHAGAICWRRVASQRCAGHTCMPTPALLALLWIRLNYADVKAAMSIRRLECLQFMPRRCGIQARLAYPARVCFGTHLWCVTYRARPKPRRQVEMSVVWPERGSMPHVACIAWMHGSHGMSKPL